MTTLYEEPNDEQKLSAHKMGKQWKPIYHNGKISHWVLIIKRDKKPCNCGKNKKGDHFGKKQP